MRSMTLTARVVLALALSSVTAADAQVTVRISAPETPRKISPYVYGINQNPGGDPSRFPVVRSGGNRMTAWNWENNASNAGSDWHHQSDAHLGGGETPGAVARSFLEPALSRGQTAIVTIPMAGYVAGDKGPEGDVNATPDYLTKRFKKTLARKPGGKFAFPPDLTDDAVYQDEFVHWVQNTFAKPGGDLGGRVTGKVWYALDNEPDLWDHTHARIRPKKLTYTELVERTVDFAGAIKAVAPDAMVFGFVSYGYNGFATLQGAADGNGRFFVDYFLQEMAKADKAAGKRLVDVLDLHWYPETRGGPPDNPGASRRITEPAGPSATGGAVAANHVADARVQAPRHLYDPTFRENSWIDRDAVNGPINLLPTILGKIEQFYPGTKLAFTEWNYGGGEDISGTIAHADAMGAMGHHGVFAACWWSLAEKNPYTAAAFDLFLNYDGRGARFGTDVLDAKSSDLSKVSAWAARNEAGETTLLLINRSKTEEPLTLTGGPANAFAYVVTAGSPDVRAAGPVDLTKPLTLPANSVTLWVGR